MNTPYTTHLWLVRYEVRYYTGQAVNPHTAPESMHRYVVTRHDNVTDVWRFVATKSNPHGSDKYTLKECVYLGECQNGDGLVTPVGSQHSTTTTP